MRPSASAAANATAWVILIGLICVAFVMVVVLGPFGLVLLGLRRVDSGPYWQDREARLVVRVGEPHKAGLC
jgi:hypothetical protein